MKFESPKADKLADKFIDELITRYPIAATRYPQIATAQKRTIEIYKLHFLYDVKGEK